MASGTVSKLFKELVFIVFRTIITVFICFLLSHKQNFLYQSQTALEQVQNCEQKIAYNRVVSTSCLEKHVLRPFSNENDGATTMVEQSINYIESTYSRQSKFYNILNIIFFVTSTLTFLSLFPSKTIISNFYLF